MAFLAVLVVHPAVAGADDQWDYHYSCDQTPAPGYAACLGIQAIPPDQNAESSGTARPQATPASYRATPIPGALTPSDLRSAYQLPSDTAEASTQTVAIIDAYDDPTAESDLAVFSNQYGLPACTTANGCFTKINQNGGSSMPAINGSWAAEITLDVQMVHAVCQSCKILLVEANSNMFSDLTAAVTKAVALGATEISNSYGGGETSSLISDTHYDHPGIVITASAGDYGYLSNQASSGGGVPEYPASSPYVLSVGGTTLTQSSGVWNSTVWSASGGGCSTVFDAPDWQSQADGYADLDCAGKRSDNDIAVVGNPSTGVSIYDSTPDGSYPTGWMLYGGTSAGAPIVAAEYGLAGGSDGAAFPAAILYSHQDDSKSFYDVVEGSNSASCTSNSCRATVGFDGPSGLGSPLGLTALTSDASNAPGVISEPVVNGDPTVGSTLSASKGSYSGTGPFYYDLSWWKCNAVGGDCQVVPGAATTTYVPTNDDIGSTMVYTEVVHGTDGSITGRSLPTAVITARQTPPSTSPPNIVDPGPPIVIRPGVGSTSNSAPPGKSADKQSQLGLRSHRLRLSGKYVKLRLRCSGTRVCKGAIVLTATRRGHVLARRHYRLRPGTGKTLRLPLTRRSVKYMCRHRSKFWVTLNKKHYRVSLLRCKPSDLHRRQR